MGKVKRGMSDEEWGMRKISFLLPTHPLKLRGCTALRSTPSSFLLPPVMIYKVRRQHATLPYSQH
jgi:hypothetical protein